MIVPLCILETLDLCSTPVYITHYQAMAIFFLIQNTYNTYISNTKDMHICILYKINKTSIYFVYPEDNFFFLFQHLRTTTPIMETIRLTYVPF